MQILYGIFSDINIAVRLCNDIQYFKITHYFLLISFFKLGYSQIIQQPLHFIVSHF